MMLRSCLRDMTVRDYSYCIDDVCAMLRRNRDRKVRSERSRRGCGIHALLERGILTQLNINVFWLDPFVERACPLQGALTED